MALLDLKGIELLQSSGAFGDLSESNHPILVDAAHLFEKRGRWNIFHPKDTVLKVID